MSRLCQICTLSVRHCAPCEVMLLGMLILGCVILGRVLESRSLRMSLIFKLGCRTMVRGTMIRVSQVLVIVGLILMRLRKA